jgi:ADP-ribosyl-[dinitrogen reductase] hydrolase
MERSIDRFRGCLLGLAAGDAVGTTVEFRSRGSFAPMTDMVGGGPFELEAGQWTDDTSMALCLATSLLDFGEFDPANQMDLYYRWYRDGYLSSNGECFDIGNTVFLALADYQKTRNPYSGSTSPNTAGNGCIMRLAPIPMFYHYDRDLIQVRSAESSRTTHGAAECLDACRWFGDVLYRALAGASKAEILAFQDCVKLETPTIQAIARGEYKTKSMEEIRGSGYVVASLEAALWCFWQTESFEEAILMAANLGEDADTTAAICGQVAGAHYGASGIPETWRSKLTMLQEMTTLADRLYEVACV